MNTEATLLNVQRDALATALVRFLEMTGGPDGMSTGSGADPREVRKQALEALSMAGVAYPRRQTPLTGAAVLTYMAPYASREIEATTYADR